MTPKLSKRLGKVMDAPSMLKLSFEEREQFIRNVGKAETFADLGIRERNQVLTAEREIYERRKKES